MAPRQAVRIQDQRSRTLSKTPLSCHIPKGPIGVAFSGGPDSIYAAQRFIRERREVTLYHFNHGTAASNEMEHFVRNWCCFKPVELVVGSVSAGKSPSESWEEYWRNQRYAFLHAQDQIIATGHNLDDQIETYLFNAFHGRPRLMPNSFHNVIRPFLYLSKGEMESLVQGKVLKDPTNDDLRYVRNRIRRNIVPEIKMFHPGLETTIKKMMREAGYDSVSPK